MRKIPGRWQTWTSIAGAALIALTVAARRLGWGTGAGSDGPSFWLALLFLTGAGLLLVVLVGRLAELVRKR